MIRFKKIGDDNETTGERADRAAGDRDDPEATGGDAMNTGDKKKKKISKQQKLKEKIKLLKEQRRVKKEANAVEEPLQTSAETVPKFKSKSINVKSVKQQLRTNNTVLSEKFDKMRNKDAENAGSDDDFLVKKRTINPENDDDELGITGIKRLGKPLSVSKRQLKKIKPEGHFGGMNKVKFDEEGKP